jgi:predicted  nucleic acid-binding Zn-ribbon protein
MVMESVRCLECGALYAKPAGGGTVRENPGCPECGYVGWKEAAALTAAARQPHSGADRPPDPSG